MRVIAVPVKSLSKAKQRLAGFLDPLERASLTLAMLEDVIDATLALSAWETWVISPDEAVLEVAARRGARPLAEERPPLGAAVRQVELEARGEDVQALAVVLADLPFLTSDALSQALHTLGPVVISPAEGEDGTNLLLRRPPRAIPARFGVGSFAKHQASAESRGLPVAEVRHPDLAFDLDTIGHLVRVLDEGREGRTRSVCVDMDLPRRLERQRRVSPSPPPGRRTTR